MKDLNAILSHIIRPLYKRRDELVAKLKHQFNQILNFRNFVVQRYGGLDGSNISSTIQKLYRDYPKGCPIKDVDPAVSQRYCSDPEVRRITDLDQESRQIDASINEYYTNSKLSDFQKLELQVRFDQQVAMGIIPNKSIPDFKLPGNGKKTTYLCTSPQAYTLQSTGSSIIFKWREQA